MRTCLHCEAPITAKATIVINGRTFRVDVCENRECRAEEEDELRMGLHADKCHYEAFGY
jgi:hypothetical protein